MSSPHKCNQESSYSAFNTMAVAFSQIFWALPTFFQIHRTRLPLQSFLEGSSSGWDANLRFASHVREYFHPQTSLHVFLICGALHWTFITYQQSPRTSCCPRIGPWPNILIWASTPALLLVDKKLISVVAQIKFSNNLLLKICCKKKL